MLPKAHYVLYVSYAMVSVVSDDRWAYTLAMYAMMASLVYMTHHLMVASQMQWSLVKRSARFPSLNCSQQRE